ncbi:hypothetical protein [Lysobacter antibioticus]|uniref:Lipoprotein n=1 Tax=Lysobacter antibioticus TaxID=84531 RepID=A0A0S2FCC0_LYSAN|nr:hypothetical protein [Lysobacter antibioticus]ALN81208.1 hypothetical protein LA76x_3080 [Lysobacter antibioticus]
MEGRIAVTGAWLLALALSACVGPDDENAKSPANVAAPSPPAPVPMAATAFDFAAWIGANAACQGEYFADVQDAAFAQTLRQAGVAVDPDSNLGDVGPGSGRLTPSRPTRLHGFLVRHVDYDFGSGSTFAVVVEASAEQARAAIGARPVPEAYREYFKLGVPTAKPSENVPMPDLRFVRPGEQAGTQEIGCAAFDG